MKKRELLQEIIEHIDIKSFDSTPIINGMRKMSFSSRETANAADVLVKMLKDKKCSVILTLSGSTSAAGCMQIFVDMVRHNMVDAIVATGAAIVDMDFFEGYKYGLEFLYPHVSKGGIIMFDEYRSDEGKWPGPVKAIDSFFGERTSDFQYDEACAKYFYVKPETCVECVGHADTPRCAEACPTEGAIVWDMPYTTDFEEYYAAGNEEGKYKIRDHKKKGLMLPSVKSQSFIEEIDMAVRESKANVMDSF